MEILEIKNGDIFDIGQTVNGVSKFLLLNDIWYYFEERMSRKYEYDQADLTKCIYNRSGLEEIKHLGNVFNLEKANPRIETDAKTITHTKYTLINNYILKDGDTMLKQDIVRDLWRKSFLEEENTNLKNLVESQRRKLLENDNTYESKK